MALVERLKHLVDDAREADKRQLEDDDDGRACAEGSSAFQDALDPARLRFHHTARLSRQEPDRGGAHGGGGAGRLWARLARAGLRHRPSVPRRRTSRRPVLVALPSTCSIWLSLLSGFKVGHATRTINECISLSHSDMTIRTALLDARLILGDEEALLSYSSTGSARRCSRATRGSSSKRKARLEQNERQKLPLAPRAIWSSRTSRTESAACATCTRCTGSRSTSSPSRQGRRPAEFVEAGVFNETQIGASAAAESFLGRCAVISISDPAADR